MTTKKSGQFTCGSDLPQEKIVKEYVRALSKDGDPKYFDSRILDLLRKYLKPGYDIDEIVSQCDSISYSASAYEYEQIEEQIKRFQSSNHPYFGWNKNYKKAKALLMLELAKRASLRTLNYRGNDDIMSSLPRKDTHAGADWLVTGSRKKGDYSEDIYALLIKAEAEALETGSFRMPILIGSRRQASSPFNDVGYFVGTFKRKTRLVSMIALRIIITELRWAKPVQSWLSNFKWYAGGKNDIVLSNLMNQFRSKSNYWISIDYSGFDQSISKWLIYDAFEILEPLFKRDSNHNSELYWIMVKDFCDKAFIDGKGKLRYSNKGVPSGSMFTQIIDTVVNRLMILTYLIAKGHESWSYEMCIMGDDNIIFSDKYIDPADLEGYLNKNFGVKVNASKSSQGTKADDPEFLSRKWSYSGAYREWKTLMVKLLYPERFRSYANGKAFPELVLYSYVLAYPVTFNQILDLAEFYKDYPNLQNRIEKEGAAGLSGYLSYYRRYLAKN